MLSYSKLGYKFIAYGNDTYAVVFLIIYTILYNNCGIIYKICKYNNASIQWWKISK